MEDFIPVILYCALWFSFGVGHSFLARQSVKRQFEKLSGPYYRLSYNAIALLHILFVYVGGLYLFSDFKDYERSTLLQGVQLVIYLSGWLIMLISLREYDLGLLAGTKQVRLHWSGLPFEAEEPLHFRGVHCWVRHPLYAAGFLILWGRVGNDLDLWTALFGSLYLVIGTWYEERHLISVYPDVYVQYKERVPAFIPLKGRLNLKDLNHD